MKEETRKVVVGSDFFQETTKVTLMTLKLALEPLLFFFVLEFFFRMTGWASPPSVVFTLESQHSGTAFATTHVAALDPFTEKLSG